MSRANVHPKEPKIDVTITDEKGQAHHITCEVIGASFERGENYAKAIQDSAHDELHKRFNLPENVWFPHVEGHRPSVEDVTTQMAEFANGNLTDFHDLYFLLDEEWDLDPTYLLFGIPIADLSPEQQEELCKLGEHFGCWRTRELLHEEPV